MPLLRAGSLVEPKEWRLDLHSVYSSFISHLADEGKPWYTQRWGQYFSKFESFLAFNWPVILVSDLTSGRPHIVTRLTEVERFISMIKNDYGANLTLQEILLTTVEPFEREQKTVRFIKDSAGYQALAAELPGVEFFALKTRVRKGDPAMVQKIWNARDSTFLAIDFEWKEGNGQVVLEFGYAALRCGYLKSKDIWPPDPAHNYRHGHYIVTEYVDTVFNVYRPTNPWMYAFGESHLVSRLYLPRIIRSIISSLLGPNTVKTSANRLILIGHNIQHDLLRLQEMDIVIENDVFVLDTSVLERVMYSNGLRPDMRNAKTGGPRTKGTTLSLENLLRSISLASSPSQPQTQPPSIFESFLSSLSPQASVSEKPLSLLPDGFVSHNAGNDAFVTLLALQALLAPDSIKEPPRVKSGRIGRPESC